MLFLLIPIGWVGIMAMFMALCHTAARAEAGTRVQGEAAVEDPVRIRRRGARARGRGMRLDRGERQGSHARAAGVARDWQP